MISELQIQEHPVSKTKVESGRRCSWPPWAHTQAHTHTQTYAYTRSYAQAHMWHKITSWKCGVLDVISYNQISYQFQFVDEWEFREILKAGSSVMLATFWVCVSCFRLLLWRPLSSSSPVSLCEDRGSHRQNPWPCVYSPSTCLTHEERGEIILRLCVLCCFILVCSGEGKARVLTRSIGCSHPWPNTLEASPKA